MRSLSWTCLAVALAHRHHRPTAPTSAAAWTWSLSDNNGLAASGPRVSGGACETIAAPADADAPAGAASGARIFLFGGQPLGPPPDGALAVTGGAGAAVASSAASRRSTLAEARAEAAAAAAAKADADALAALADRPPHLGPATHDLWVYERDRADGGDEWARIPRRVQGVSRPSPRTHAATAVLGHLLFLFGGYDPATEEALSDVWVLSTRTLKWSRSQAWLPYPAWGHSAAAVSDTTIVLHTHKGVLLYDDDTPTPEVVERPTTGKGPDGLRLCAGCGIKRQGVDVAAAAGRDLLVFGGAAGDRLSAAAYVLDTRRWAWTELRTPLGAARPPPLRSPCTAMIDDGTCLAFGGAARGEDGAGLVATDAAWLLAVRDGAAAWERLARPGGEGPAGREAAALGAAGPGALVLRGGRDPADGGEGAGDPGTWLLTERPVDPRAAAARRAARRTARDAEGAAADGATAEAAARVADVIARAGGAAGFDGAALGVGGLEDVLAEVRRRIWTPLAAPPALLTELGIQPTRGLLLYGAPGCGKTLLASTLGEMMSPFRPITVVNGPEILDKFVGSSEANLRQIFDSPPDIYEECRKNETDGGAALSRAAVHIVVMDEFDAVARARGGGGGGQGDAGVARDSVVNQLLAKMDGVQPLAVPTLVIGLTNKRSLIEPALLRPGRFEVQIEITPPKTVAQRRSIMAVHTKQMVEAGRLQVQDPPPGSAAARQLSKTPQAAVLTYDQLTHRLAIECDGFSGAAIAGVARAAASRALARAVGRMSGEAEHASEDGGAAPSSMMDCLVTQDDFYRAVNDIRESMGTGDRAEAAVVDNGVDRRRVGFRSQLRHRLRTWILAE